MKWRARARSVLPLAGGWFWVATTRLSKTIRVDNGARVISRPRVRVCDGAEIQIGDGVVLNSSPVAYHTAMPTGVTLIADRPGAVIRIGRDCRLNGATIHAQASVTLGDRVLMAAESVVLDSNGHPIGHQNRNLTRDAPRPVIIEDDVWIGLRAVVLPGSHIGRGSVVGANAVVSGSIPPNSIVRSSVAISEFAEDSRRGIETPSDGTSSDRLP